ncbi:MAG: Re/Si-specific NAD(P)(+) transhydrogenase subunit alpha [Nitrosomonas sp.]|jgi:NAD(P) transhydrogenase subunit alpha|uniref:Re/Si-specific NAD(P)(+) transhydrogenase subunit alpha n=1 Tax=Nitrosomonas sp. TaxID=42353 RepID=UPI00271FD83A|nr:Re/Si-specific NAD(P)(+) transhydrogenase subunit alpha [Nitrosomonas sp.]MDO8894517.1 Re/Si-specific NAD(P)(+) transhydrogenase subunit alpha [Nitrosomonas sp.]MDO9469567.1 Re/Si-specific NAD(P)(+) transhydrogenase subunit alpha [Nitrosomonas sp.]MDP1787711.1 Re/Si-specific NAD(P)(+) transhydrogenase subunit alpha [Nitrosomonas sp.]MDP1934561.1 Re/Si-specific NAD(P)(+) transhydrogenase subunit alpha [Nitrosomonas sp.]MDP2224654.1 Re/Si-specific NAD(P)(+) transhydrogenase subunit alpha [Nit
MHIGIPAEIRGGETRVAATPETVKKYTAKGVHKVLVQSGAGAGASIPDSAYQEAGATIVTDVAELYAQSQIVLKVRSPESSELAMLRKDAVLLGLLSPHHKEGVDALVQHGLTAFAMEKLPRISRAQNMDVLSSQANIAGYKAVIMAANVYQRFFPMLMTAAGTVKAARVLILGAGVAGLQAIATAKRLGAVVEAFDVRPAVKEQVESLGAKFVEVPLSEEEKAKAETAGGYATEMSEDYKRRQGELVHERASAADIIITTALIPGRPAPVLIKEETVQAMKPGSVIVDMAVEAGGNCPLSELDKTVVKHGVHLIGIANLPGLVAADSSTLYARNLMNFLNLMLDPESGELKIDRSDEIIAGTLLCSGGEIASKA